MPKIGKVHKTIDGKLTELEVYFKKGDGFTIKNWPESVANVTDVRMGSGPDTYDELIHKVDEALKKYHDITATSRMVILYSVRAHGTMGWKHGSFDSFGSWSGRNDIPNWMVGLSPNHGAGNGICIEFYIAKEVVKNGKPEYSKRRISNGEEKWSSFSKADDKFKAMEWTEQREKFFVDLELSMIKMASACIAFFSTTEDSLSNLIDTSNGSLLLTGGNNEH